jgi:hypothetical protein
MSVQESMGNHRLSAIYLVLYYIHTLLSWLQSSFRKTTSKYFSDNSLYFGAITLQGRHLKKFMIDHIQGYPFSIYLAAGIAMS